MGFLKGVAWLSTCALATVGALTFVPDDAWESFPEAFAPVRAQLANIGVAPARYGEYAPHAARYETPTDPNELAFEPDRNERSNDYGRYDSAPSDRPRVRIGGHSGAEAAPQSSPQNVPAAPDDSSFTGVSTEPANAPAEPAPVVTAPSVPDFDLYDRNFGESLPNQEAPAPIAPNFPAGTDADLFGAPAPITQNESFPNSGLESVVAPTNPPFASPAPERELVHEDSLGQQVNPQTINPQDITQNITNDAPVAQDAPASSLNSVVAPVQPLEPQAAPETTQNLQPQPQPQSQPQSLPAQTLAPPPVANSTNTYEPTPNSEPALNCAPPSYGVSSLAQNNPDAELNAALASAQNIESAEQLRDVFFTLNRLRATYDANGAVEQLDKINAALDQLAYHVFYDPQRAILEPFHQARPGETLASLARECQVTPDTLAAINGLAIPFDAPLQPGSTLKVVRGPVTAELSKSKKELLLKFNNLYAGRFKFGVPQQARNISGEYVVESKMENPACDAVDINGAKMTIPGGSPDNPLGSCWIGLNGGYGLQGTNRSELVGADVPENGGFVFSNREISQLNVLLPIGSSLYFLD